jgi:S-adenosylmethionine synthetase
MQNTIIRRIQKETQDVEMVERKGKGHPDTLIDSIMERVSLELSKAYIEKFGRIKHHNVDKGLICGGATNVKFGGGEFTKPIKVILSGRAHGGVDVEKIAKQAARECLKENLRYLNVDKDVIIEFEITEIWPSWDEFSERESVPLANDTSFGVGYAPSSETEKLVLEAEKLLNSDNFKTKYLWSGEDVKVMGLREKNTIYLTIAIALISRHIRSLDEYIEAKKIIRKEVECLSKKLTDKEICVVVNNADNEKAGSIYLTLSGTSAEMGDDGSVGRGNRANGLITPFRPMTLEATAGKNPVSHTGRIYSILAFEMAERIIKNSPEIRGAEVYLLSEIGRPINNPKNCTVFLDCDEKYFETVKEKAEKIVNSELAVLGAPDKK